MQIKPVTETDRSFWLRHDHHATAKGFADKVSTGTGYVLWEDGAPIGLLHYSVLWNSCPFLNLLFLSEEHRHKGCGTAALLQWEREMKAQGFQMLLLSTRVDERAQNFDRKLGYVDCGGIVLDHTPLEQPLELLMRKVI